ncbi:class I SAM-dependent methyltransferase [Lutimonas sp.]|uniref:class I SAM-dependent methyltransferase n=1 Tax=Lutimonas sp. TaxID=1872403 RepID=UPI003D9AD888
MGWNVDLYNKKHGFVHEYGADLVQVLDPKPDERILDLGCGSGQLTKEIAAFTDQVIGIDSSKEMIETSQEMFQDLEFYQMNAESFQFDRGFDAIFSNAVLHWVKDQKAASQNMLRHLKSGGRLVVEFGGAGNVATITNAIRSCLEDRGYLTNASLERWYFPSISAYSSLLEEVGFEVVHAQLYDRPTLLDSKNAGIKDWIEMFGAHFFEGVEEGEKNDILDDVQKKVESSCFYNGNWYADYRRIRVVAIRK